MTSYLTIAVFSASNVLCLTYFVFWMYLTFDREESQLKGNYWAALLNKMSPFFIFLLLTEGQFARYSYFALAQLLLCGSQTMDMNWAVAVHFFWDTGAFSWSQFSVIFFKEPFGTRKVRRRTWIEQQVVVEGGGGRRLLVNNWHQQSQLPQNGSQYQMYFVELWSFSPMAH